jgi:hypothetical protein
LLALFRLASHLGKTVAEMDMTWREFIYWQAYLAEEPPEQGANHRAASLMAQIANYAGKSLPDGKRMKASDFLPRKAQSAHQQRAFFQNLSRGLNGS